MVYGAPTHKLNRYSHVAHDILQLLYNSSRSSPHSAYVPTLILYPSLRASTQQKPIANSSLGISA